MGWTCSLSDNTCCTVHTLLWTFPGLSILVRLRLPRLGQPAEISIQRWTLCKDIVLLSNLEKGGLMIFCKWRRCFSSVLLFFFTWKNKLKPTKYSTICIFNHILHCFLPIAVPADFTLLMRLWINIVIPNCWEAVFLFLSYGFLPDGILIPESGISALKTDCAASQMDNTAGSTHANR